MTWPSTPGTLRRVQLLDDDVAVGVDADFGGDVERALDDAARIELRAFEERPRGGECVLSAGPDGRDVVVGLDHVAVTGDDEQLVRIADQEQRLETPQVAVRAPVLRQLDRGTRQVAVLLELALETLEQREGIGRAAGKARDDFVAGEAAHLARVALHHGIAEGDLSVTADGNRTWSAHANDGGAVRIETCILDH